LGIEKMTRIADSIFKKSLVFIIYSLVIFLFASCIQVNYEISPTKRGLPEDIKETESATEIHIIQPSFTPAISRATPIIDEPATANSILTATLVKPTETNIVITMDVTKIVPETLREYIGLKYSDLPDGLSSGFGMLIVPEKKGVFALDGVHGNQQHMLWFEKRVFWNSDGKRQKGWEVLDILELEPLDEEDEVLIPSGCMLNQVLDPEIMVIANLDKEADRTRFVTNDKILRAWRLNRDLELIEEISTNNIECYADMAMKW
jgi:hypothetical protein